MATILIIDDQESIRALLRTTLEAAGHEVREASNCRIGLDLYRQKPTDLVITDILMPELNGLDMILELTREFLDAKVIAISGSGEGKHTLDHAKLLGARRTFRMPFSLPQLLGAVRYELEHYGAFPRGCHCPHPRPPHGIHASHTTRRGVAGQSIRSRLARVAVVWCEQSLPRTHGSNKCPSEHPRH